MSYFSLLLEDEMRKIKRQDYCPACWNEMAASENLAASRGYWKSKIDEKKKAVPASRPERALILLKSLLEKVPAPESEIFVLVLLLCHVRRLTLRKELIEDSVKYGLYEILNQDEFLKIKIINLTDIEIEKIRASLAAQL